VHVPELVQGWHRRVVRLLGRLEQSGLLAQSLGPDRHITVAPQVTHVSPVGDSHWSLLVATQHAQHRVVIGR
jgi:hypothetical protein